MLAISKSILKWWENGQYSNKRTYGFMSKTWFFSNTRYPKYPMILKIYRVRIGYWKIFQVRVEYRVPVGPCWVRFDMCNSLVSLTQQCWSSISISYIRAPWHIELLSKLIKVSTKEKKGHHLFWLKFAEGEMKVCRDVEKNTDVKKDWKKCSRK